MIINADDSRAMCASGVRLNGKRGRFSARVTRIDGNRVTEALYKRAYPIGRPPSWDRTRTYSAVDVLWLPGHGPGADCPQCKVDL